MDAKKSSFGGVKFSITRLKSGNRSKRVKIVKKSLQNQAFKNFGKKTKFRDETIVR